MSGWEVFQADVLDSLNQYEGFFDFFRRTGSFKDGSRPDCIARRTGETRKIWVFDAKNKDEISEEDEERMQGYVEKIRKNPLEIGLDHSEIGEHDVEGIFITSGPADSGYRVVPSPRLHSFLRKELIYPETDQVVRDLASMAEKKALTHDQARMLYRGLSEFRERMNRAEKAFDRLESRFQNLEVVSRVEDGSIPVDFRVTHRERDQRLMVDVPYRGSRAEKMENVLEDDDLYVEIGPDSRYSVGFQGLEDRVREAFGVLSVEDVVEIFRPKISVERTVEPGKAVLRNDEAGYRLEVRGDDTSFRVEASLPDKAVEEVSNRRSNLVNGFGEVDDGFGIGFEVGRGLEIRHSSVEGLESFRDSVETVLHSAANPVLSRRVSRGMR